MHDVFLHCSHVLCAPCCPPFFLSCSPNTVRNVGKTSNLGTAIFIFLSNSEHKAHRLGHGGLPNVRPIVVPRLDRPFAKLTRPRGGLRSSAAGWSRWLYLQSAPQDICWRRDSVLCVHTATHRGSLSTFFSKAKCLQGPRSEEGRDGCSLL